MRNLFLLLAASMLAFAQQKPNLLLIYADDLGYGYGDVQCDNPENNSVQH